MAKKTEQAQTMAHLATRLAALRQHKDAVRARLKEIHEIRARAADPEAEGVDIDVLRGLAREQGELTDLLQVVDPRIRAIEAAQREAQEQERAARALALRPKELQVIRRFEAWLADGVKVMDECASMAREIGTKPRCIPNAQLERLVRHFHKQAATGKSVISLYVDWDGKRRRAVAD